MKNVHYIWLIFPVSILVAGFLVLGANLQTERSFLRNNSRQAIDKTAPQDAVLHTEKALPYFLLSSVFILLILVLPRLQELSISDKTLVLKLASEVREEVDQLGETVPAGQEILKTGLRDEKLISIKAKTALIEQLLKKGK